MYRNVLFIFASLLLHVNFCFTQKINVQVLYESLCEDSKKFITQQLYPVWNDLAPHVDIQLVPFGKSASINDGLQFVCQHGPKECLGNKIQSCALKALQDQTAQVEYVNCFMKVFKKHQGNYELGQSCAEAVGLDWNYMTDCFSSTLGTELQLEAERVTNINKPKFVPSIIYNGRYDQLAHGESLKDFRTVACSHVTQLNPNACKGASILRL